MFFDDFGWNSCKIDLSIYVGAQYTSIVEERPEAFIPTVDFKDTFLDAQHLRDSFPGALPRRRACLGLWLCKSIVKGTMFWGVLTPTEARAMLERLLCQARGD